MDSSSGEEEEYSTGLSEEICEQISNRKDVGSVGLSNHYHLRFNTTNQPCESILSNGRKWRTSCIEKLRRKPEKLKLACQKREFDGVNLRSQPVAVQALDAAYPNRQQGTHVTSIEVLSEYANRREFRERWTAELNADKRILEVSGMVVGQRCRFKFDIHPGEPDDLRGIIVGDAIIPGYVPGVIIGFGSYADAISFLNVFMDLA